MEPLPLSQRVGMVAMSLVTPRRLARLILKPPAPERPGRALNTAGLAERIEFGSGGVACRGWWVRPQHQASDACVVLAHGWTSNAHRMSHFIDPLLARGYQVMLYDARSHGESDPFDTCAILQFSEDAGAAAEFARTRAGRVAMVGHSMGAAATLVAAAEGAPVEAAVALAPPSHPVLGSRDILTLLGAPAGLIMRRITDHVQTYLGKSFESFAPEVRVTDVTCPVLLMHGTADRVVPVEHFRRIRANAGANVQAHEMAGMDHDEIKLAPTIVQRVVSFLGEQVPAL